MTTKQFEYAALPARDVLALATVLGFETTPPGGYVSDDVPHRALSRLLDGGFRWVRTEGEFALFEREVLGRPGAGAARAHLALALRALARAGGHRPLIVEDAIAQIADLHDLLANVEATDRGAR